MRRTFVLIVAALGFSGGAFALQPASAAADCVYEAGRTTCVGSGDVPTCYDEDGNVSRNPFRDCGTQEAEPEEPEALYLTKSEGRNQANGFAQRLCKQLKECRRTTVTPSGDCVRRSPVQIRCDATFVFRGAGGRCKLGVLVSEKTDSYIRRLAKTGCRNP